MKTLFTFAILVAAVLLSACGTIEAGVEGQPATVTPVPEPTQLVVTTTLPAASTDAPSSPTAAQPTVAPTLPSATVLPAATSVQPTVSAAQFNQVKIFLIALNDNGKSGPKVGCGDSAVAVTRQVPPTAAPLTAALNELLSIHSQYYGESGLYNALYQSNLQVQSVILSNGKATIKLTGTMSLGGECDDPRFEAQLTQTALQFTTVQSVDIYINDKPLNTLLGGKGQ